MSLKIDPSGRRAVQVEVEVQGSSDEVWTAIGTGPGISCWFVPTEFDTLADDRPARVVCHFGPGIDSAATVTAWEPPGSFVADSEDFAPGGPSVTTEWTV